MLSEIYGWLMMKTPPKKYKSDKNALDADPEGCDSVPKSVEGVDGQDSVWSSIHPPASSSKRSNGTRLTLCRYICCTMSIVQHNLLCDIQDCKIE